MTAPRRRVASDVTRDFAAYTVACALDYRIGSRAAFAVGDLLVERWGNLRLELVAALGDGRHTLADVAAHIDATEATTRRVWRGLRAIAVVFHGQEHRVFRRAEELFFFRDRRIAIIGDPTERPQGWRVPRCDPDELDPGTYAVPAESFYVGASGGAR